MVGNETVRGEHVYVSTLMYQYAGHSPCIEHVEGARSKATSHLKKIKQRHYTTTQSNLYSTIDDFIARMLGVLDVLKDYWSSFWTRPAIIDSNRTIYSNHDDKEWNPRQRGEAIVGPNMEGVVLSFSRLRVVHAI